MAKKKNLLQSMEEDRRNRRTFRQAMAKGAAGTQEFLSGLFRAAHPGHRLPGASDHAGKL